MNDIKETQKMSPIPKEVYANQMGFADAIQAIIAGKKVTKLEWNTQEVYGLLRDGRLTLFIDNTFKDWIVSEADMVGEDWTII